MEVKNLVAQVELKAAQVIDASLSESQPNVRKSLHFFFFTYLVCTNNVYIYFYIHNAG